MDRFASGALALMLPWLGSMALAAPPQYAVIDLGVQEAGQGLQWQAKVGSPVTNYPGLGGNNLIYAINSTAQVGTAATPDQTAVNAARWVPFSTGPGATFTDLGVLPNASRP